MKVKGAMIRLDILTQGWWDFFSTYIALPWPSLLISLPPITVLNVSWKYTYFKIELLLNQNSNLTINKFFVGFRILNLHRNKWICRLYGFLRHIEVFFWWILAIFLHFRPKCRKISKKTLSKNESSSNILARTAKPSSCKEEQQVSH